MQGKKVLLVDADPQDDHTTCLGWQDTDSLPQTLSNKLSAVMREEQQDPFAGILSHEEKVDLVPSNLGSLRNPRMRSAELLTKMPPTHFWCGSVALFLFMGCISCRGHNFEKSDRNKDMSPCRKGGTAWAQDQRPKTSDL